MEFLCLHSKFIALEVDGGHVTKRKFIQHAIFGKFHIISYIRQGKREFYLWNPVGTLFHIFTILLYFSGIGFAIIIVMMLINTYYNVLNAYALYYMFASITNELPWSQCGQKWNTNKCTAARCRKYIHTHICACTHKHRYLPLFPYCLCRLSTTSSSVKISCKICNWRFQKNCGLICILKHMEGKGLFIW